MKFVFRIVKIPEDISSLKHQIKFDRAPQRVKTIPINEQTMQIPCSLNFITRHLCSINYSNDLQQISYNYSPILVFPYNSCVGSRLQHDIFFDERYLDFNNLSKIDGRRDFWDGNRGGDRSYSWRELVFDKVYKLFWERGSEPIPNKGFFAGEKMVGDG